MSARELITEHLDLWTGAVTKKSSSGRGSNGKVELTGVKKLRELILELAVRGKLVSQDMPTESSSDLIAVMEKEKAKLVNSKRIKRPKAVSSESQENRPFAIPENWSWHSLGALGYTQTGSTPSKSQSELFGFDIPFLKPGDISESGEICYGNEGLSEAGKEVLGKWAEKDSILMVCIGTIGKCGLIEQQCTFNQQINSVTPFVPEISQFLFLCLKSPYFQSAAWEKSSSTTISILNKGKWESIPVPLPPLEEQHRIVQKVDELMALCDRLEQQTSDQLEAHETLVDTLLGTLSQSENATELAGNWARLAAHFDTLFTTEQSIDKLKQTILQLAVMGRLVEQDVGDEPAQELIAKLSVAKASLIKEGKLKKSRKLPDISDEETGIPLPRGWLLTRLGDAYDVRDGTHDSPKYQTTGYPLITSKNLSSGELSFDDVKLISESDHQRIQERSRVRQGDILFAMIGSIGNPVIVNTDREFSIKNVALFKYYSDELSSPSYLKLFLENAAEDLKRQAAGGVQSFVSLGKLRSWLIPLPPLGEQHRIVQKADELIALCDQLKERLSQVSETRCQLAEAVVEGALAL